MYAARLLSVTMHFAQTLVHWKGSVMALLQTIGRIVYLLLAALFVYVAWLQVNDPDAPRWMMLYAAAAMLCVVAALGPRLAVTLAGLGALGYATYLGVVYFTGQSVTPMFNDQPADTLPWYKIEEAREMVGLIVITLVIFSQLLWYWLVQRSPKTSEATSSET
jgi:hypothetical protein